MSAAADIQHQQDETMPREDLSRFAGQWVALRDGRVVASDIDPVALRDNPQVTATDDLVPVPADGAAILIL
jgi:hypothetical protein